MAVQRARVWREARTRKGGVRGVGVGVGGVYICTLWIGVLGRQGLLKEFRTL
jgi:hypothetical protein